MATRKNTAAHELSTPDAAARINLRRADEAAARLDTTIPVALALADALKVLTALENTTAHNEADGMITGNGYAAGHRVVDNTMPDLAVHLRGLIKQIGIDARVIGAAAPRGPVSDEPNREATNG